MIEWLLSKLETFEIVKEEGVYLRRYYLYPRTPRAHRRRAPRFSVRIHEILLSDSDRALHDHPWNFLSIILKGGYIESTPTASKWKGRGRIIFHKAEDLHALTLKRDAEGNRLTAWSLVIFGQRRRQWGFQTKNGWVPWTEYVDGQS